MLILRKMMEFKGWVTDYSRGSIQGITVPEQAHKWIDWNQTRKEQETWPNKTMVSMWFKNQTNFVTMVDLLKIMEKTGKKQPTRWMGRMWKSVFRGDPWQRHTLCSSKDSRRWKVMNLKLWLSTAYRRFFRRSARAKVTRKKAGLSTFLWCHRFVQNLRSFWNNGEVQLKKAWTGLTPKGHACAWQLISANIKRQSSTDMFVIAEKLLEPFRTRAHLLDIFLSKRRDPRMFLTWSCLGMCVMIANLASPRCLFRISFCKIKRLCSGLWNHFGAGRLRSGLRKRYGGKWDIHFESYQRRREGRRGGAKDFYLTGDLNVEL